jgi:hypothetical protein
MGKSGGLTLPVTIGGIGKAKLISKTAKFVLNIPEMILNALIVTLSVAL